MLRHVIDQQTTSIIAAVGREIAGASSALGFYVPTSMDTLSAFT